MPAVQNTHDGGADRGTAPLVELASVTVQYPASRPLDDLSLRISAGTTALMGPSGSGKSTLLRLIAGLQPPSSGRVTIDGTEVVRPSWRTASDPRVSIIHQSYQLVPFMTVDENLRLAAELRSRRPSESDVHGALERVGLGDHHAGRVPSALSGGEQQRVAIARALLSGARVLVADEPTGALDVKNTGVVADLFADLARQASLTILVATHDPAVAVRMDRRLEIGGGKVQEVS